ncbi:hypothetical protein ACS0TY_016885 [Phlomoides rotata]
METVLKMVAERVGKLECYEKPKEMEVNLFLRFKVEIDFTKPLLRGPHIRLMGGQLWIPLKYEFLPSYYY